MMKKVSVTIGTFLILGLGLFLSGCAPIIELSMVGAGNSAISEDTGFFKSYSGLDQSSESDKKMYPNLPDLYYISPNVHMESYKKVIIPDFTSRTTKIDNIAGLQSTYFKTIRKDLADNIVNTFEGSVFEQIVRTSERIRPKDTVAIMKLSADAVLMGNIKELVAPFADEGGKAALAAAQIEYKLIDIKTGEEVLKAIHRSTTDKNKIAAPQLRILVELLNKAKNIPQK